VLPKFQPSSSTRIFERHEFEAADLARLKSPTALLNDVCLNGTAAYLWRVFCCDALYSRHATKCALFSTYDLNRIRYKASDRDLWKSVKKNEYWQKDVWIIPIHRRQQCHWVLAVVQLKKGRILFYDSLAGKKGWRQDVEVNRLSRSVCTTHQTIQDISVFVSRLTCLAQQNNCQLAYSLAQMSACPVMVCFFEHQPSLLYYLTNI